MLNLFGFSSCAQQKMNEYIGKWKGEPSKENPFVFDVVIHKKDANSTVTISNEQSLISQTFTFEDIINISLENNIVFKGILKKSELEISGFVQYNGYLYPVSLKKSGDSYKGHWHLSAFQHLRPEGLYLTIKEGGSPDDEYTAYPIMGSFWCEDFKKQNDSISFTEYLTGLEFKGIIRESEIVLDAFLGENKLTRITYKRYENEIVTPAQGYQQNDDGWEMAAEDERLILQKMESDILNDTLIGTESVVIAKGGKVIYENYFNGFDVNTPHDMRSASKSISSVIIGIAIDNGIIESLNNRLYKHIPDKYQNTIDSSKSKITIRDLLTMSSGIGVSEGTYQQSDDWLKTVLEPALNNESASFTNYKSADPYLTGVYLSERLEIPLEIYVQNRLFSPLGIQNYVMNTDDTKQRPYFGGGLHLTPRDMLKFGQLYLNKGMWNGKRVISKDWIDESTEMHTQLEDVSDKNGYGYLWWHNTYKVNGKKIKTIEARGAGGQYIFIIPKLDSVVVITSGNYRNGKTRQPEKILEEYILQSIL